MFIQTLIRFGIILFGIYDFVSIDSSRVAFSLEFVNHGIRLFPVRPFAVLIELALLTVLFIRIAAIMDVAELANGDGMLLFHDFLELFKHFFVVLKFLMPLLRNWSSDKLTVRQAFDPVHEIHTPLVLLMKFARPFPSNVGQNFIAHHNRPFLVIARREQLNHLPPVFFHKCLPSLFVFHRLGLSFEILPAVEV